MLEVSLREEAWLQELAWLEEPRQRQVAVQSQRLQRCCPQVSCPGPLTQVEYLLQEQR